MDDLALMDLLTDEAYDAGALTLVHCNVVVARTFVPVAIYAIRSTCSLSG